MGVPRVLAAPMRRGEYAVGMVRECSEGGRGHTGCH